MNKSVSNKRPFKISEYRDSNFEKYLKRGALALAILFLVGFGATLRAQNRAVALRSPDERLYTLYANQIAQKGWAGAKDLIHDYHADAQLWQYPPPIRIGYLYLLAFFMTATGVVTVDAGAWLSFLFSVLSLGVVVLLGLRFFNAWITLAALWMMAVSNMEMILSRRCWQDSVIAFFGALLLYLAAEIHHGRRRWAWTGFFVLTGVFSILIKESGLLIYGLCSIWIFSKILFLEKNKKEAFIFSFWVGVGVLAAALILISVAGGLPSYLEVLRHIRDAMSGNQYAIKNQEGPWYFYIQGFWILSPVSLVSALLGIFFLLPLPFFKESIGPEALKLIRGLSLVALLFCAVAAGMHFFKNMRYLSVLYAFFYLLGAYGLWSLWFTARKFVGERSSKIALGLILVLLSAGAFRDYQLYQFCYVDHDAQDLSRGHLKEIHDYMTSQHKDFFFNR